MANLTPMLKQYFAIKEQYPDCILFFRMGDFYEMFFEDAKIASKELDIALTTRGKHRGEDVPLCGVPYHSVDSYLAKLVNRGFKIAICEQVEDPSKAKGIVKREVTRVITPGTILDSANLSEKYNNYIVSLVMDSNQVFGLAYLDFSTSEFKTTEFRFISEVFDELARLEPKEVLIDGGLLSEPKVRAKWEEFKKSRDEMVVNEVAEELDFTTSYQILAQHFKVDTLAGFGLEDRESAIRASAQLLDYLKKTQSPAKNTPAFEVGGREPASLNNPLSHITELRYYESRDYMVLDEPSKRNLELVRTLREGRQTGSVFGLIDFTLTPMGARTLLKWLNYPLISPEEINKRLDVVELFSSDHTLRLELRNWLNTFPDLERISTKVSMRSANARDLIAVKQALKAIPVLKNLLLSVQPELLKRIGQGLDPLEEIYLLLENSISEESPLVLREGGLIKKGFNSELDELTEISSNAKAYLASLEIEERKKTGIPSLKVGYNQVFGYYIEVTNPHLKLVPDYFIRRQTLANAERFITPELKELEAKILNAEERIIELNYQIFVRVREDVARSSEKLRHNARLVGELDAFLSLAELSARKGYVRPIVDSGDIIEIKAGRHPVVEDLNPHLQFIPNDVYMDTDSDQILIITGPNMAGKSTILRQTAIIVLLAQMGSFVPADSARIGVVDRIFTRVGASDIITKGLSTFMVEMIETAEILRYATRKSLVLLDEIGRGTSTYDGLSIAWAVVEYLHDHPEHQAKTMFATHYHELVDIAETKKRVKNYHIAVKEWGDEIIFLHKLLAGSTSRSYGIQVARLAGLPLTVIERAKEVLHNLELVEHDRTGKPVLALTRKTKAESANQLDFFSIVEDPKFEKILREIGRVELETLTPLEALNLIAKWKKDLQSS